MKVLRLIPLLLIPLICSGATTPINNPALYGSVVFSGTTYSGLIPWANVGLTSGALPGVNAISASSGQTLTLATGAIGLRVNLNGSLTFPYNAQAGLFQSDASGNLNTVANGTNGTVMTMVSGTPTWAFNATGNVSSQGTPSVGQLAAWTNSTTIQGISAINSISIGATTPSSGAFTTLAASGTVSGAGMTAYFASPPALGGTTAAAGSFTTLSASSTSSFTGVMTVSSAVAWATGVRQTFAPSGTTPGLNWGSLAGDPSTPSNGDTWYNTVSQSYRGYQNGSLITFGSSGVSTVTGTAGQVLANGTSGSGQSGGITLTIPAAMTGINSVTAASGQSYTITAGSGGNYNVILSPTGSGNVQDTSTTVSTSSTTGALTVGGGAGIAGAEFIGGTLGVTGTSTFAANTTISSTGYASNQNVILNGVGNNFQVSYSTNASGQPFQGSNTNAGAAVRAEVLMGNGTDNTLFGITGTGYSGSYLTNGPSGEIAYVHSNSNHPLVLGANGYASFYIAGTGKTFFLPSSSNAALNAGGYSGTPASASNGDIYYNSSSNALDAYVNNAWVALGSGISGATSGQVIVATGSTAGTGYSGFTATTGGVISPTPGTSTTNAAYLVPFIANATAGAQGALDTNPAFSFNPSTQALTIGANTTQPSFTFFDGSNGYSMKQVWTASGLSANATITWNPVETTTVQFPAASSFTLARIDAGQTFTGTQNMTAALVSGSTATTQTAGDNSTKIATDAFVLANAGGGAPTNGYAYRNLLLNGDMRIDQQNAGASVTVNSTSETFSVDQWVGYGVASAGVFTLQQSTSTPPTGFTNFLRATCSTADSSPAAGSVYVLENKVEGVNCQGIAFGGSSPTSVTITFQARSSLTGTFSGALSNGTGYSYPFSFTISSANTWTSESITIAGPTAGTWLTAANTIGLVFDVDLGSGATSLGTAGAWVASSKTGVTSSTRLLGTASATFDITSAQIETGTTATPFERFDYAHELVACERNLWRSSSSGTFAIFASGYANNTTTAYCFITLPVTMMAVPTLSFSTASNFVVVSPGSTNNAVSALAIFSYSPSQIMFSATTTALTAGQGLWLAYSTGTCFVQAAARL